ncbi:hypothetical protein GCM10025868_22260 [Angustibacter aerolatus]|uniref:Glycosyltransferase RgtA/B/C/D-like domain-containing protein n=1 Tax=Angustibacter aerolatus TaxID=1162965 RepID=A0ABQ6JJK1_9ACTN|nr:hypothetical protein GCM10025868_22260 [Angustibacter aerolatus]
MAPAHLAADIQDEYGGAGARVEALAFLAVAISPTAVLVWGRGLWRLLRREAWGWARPVAVAWLTSLAVVLAAAGKGYYLVGLFPALLAAGVVAAEPARRRWWALPAWLLVGVLPVLPSVLPVLPQRVYAATFWPSVVEDGRETIGWPRVVRAVAAARDTLPAGERGRASVVAWNAGEAGAIDFFGRRYDLPAAHSGHNGYGLWGPPTSDGPVVAIAPPQAQPRLEAALAGCRPVGVVRTGVDDDEDGAVVSVCTGPRGGWASAWPRLVRLSA